MDGNPTCHRTLAVQDCLDSEGIQRLVRPVRSPDLNPTENMWDALGRQVAGRNYPPTNKNTLICALTEEWDKLPQQLLDNVVQSMSPVRWPQAERRDPLKVLSSDSCRCSLANSGGYSTVWWAPHDACQPRVPRPETVNFSKESRSLRIGQRTATTGSDVVQSGRPIFDDFFQHLWPYIGNNTANVVFQMVKRLWLIRIDQ
ncbi:uncharacterized protein TNCV_2187702 [Trichonephila clavipes]|nr:uncharacterized protein TNCV_2187702 [Trichonephila clavipes]